MGLYGILIGLMAIILIPLYIRYKLSGYSKQSKHSFLIVHTGLFFTDSSWFFKSLFTKYLGLYHEYLLYNLLSGISGYGKILINLYLPQGKNVTDTEIDILFIHESGIYCIEAKDFSGYIRWDEKSPKWMQIFWKRNQFPFHNPIYQNYSHIKSLEAILPDYAQKIIPIIVFSNRSKLNVECPNNTVLQKQELKKWMKSQSHTILSKEEIDQIITTLSPYQKYTKEQERQHNSEVQILQNS